MVASYRPDVVVQPAFNADPNDPNAVPLWSDLSALFRSASGVQRGRQYELDVNQAASPSMTFLDPDEVLNPNNAGSPFAPNVVPMRPLLFQAMWPNSGTGNVLNPNMQGAVVDGSFESYGSGATVPWVMTTGSITPTVSTASPWEGTKCLQYTVTSGGEQGVGLTVPCIPGRQYIASMYVWQSAANTTLIFVDGSTSGSSTTATGSWVRLSVTFTADQPTHNVWLASFTTGTAGTVRIDGIQHEATPVLNPRPGFVQRLTGWGPSGGTMALTFAHVRTGWVAGQLTPSGTSSTTWVQTSRAPVTSTAPYRVFAWVYSAAGTGACPVGVRINWYDTALGYISTSSGSEAALPTGWTRLALNAVAPAGAAYANPVIMVSGTPASTNTVVVDTLQLTATTPTPFTTSGPVLAGVLRGYVERWPTRWDYAGFLGRAELTCVDALAALANVGLDTELRNSILAKKPTYYWSLTGQQGVITYAEESGNNGPPLIQLDTKNGPAPTFEAGGQTGIAGDPSGTGITIERTNTDLGNSIAQTGYYGSQLVGIGGTGSYSFTAMVWHHPGEDDGSIQPRPLLLLQRATTTFTDYQPLLLSALSAVPAQVVMETDFAGGAGGADLTVDFDWNTDRPHCYVAVVTVTSTTATLTLWVDGAYISTSTAATGGKGPIDRIQVPGWMTVSKLASVTNANTGVWSHVALWNRAISGVEVLDLWNAGQGYPGENSGARTSRYLGYGWLGASQVDVGQSQMGVSALSADTTLLTACQDVSSTENGNFWPDSRGTVQAASRTRRYYTTTAKWVFGEDTANGEYPYEGDIVFDFDPTYLYNDIAISNSDGFIGHATDAASQKRYFRRTYPRDVNLQSDLEAVDAANWLLTQYSTARLRVETITLHPSEYPQLWPVVLVIEVGDRVTVRRRAKAANGGAGLLMQQDYFVEQITHDNIDMDAGTWDTMLQLSPVATIQPGILNDPALGLLDFTMRLAW